VRDIAISGFEHSDVTWLVRAVLIESDFGPAFSRHKLLLAIFEEKSTIDRTCCFIITVVGIIKD
jgi:hypothetical protein